MKDVLQYKNFIGSVHFSSEDETFFGSIEGIDDLISFEGTTVYELKKAFYESVDEYIELCTKLGKPLEKSYKGNLNIRMPAELHKQASRQASLQGISLNQFIQKAVENECLISVRK